MATFSTSSGRPVIQIGRGASRRTLTLGGYTERQGRTVLMHVENIEGARLSNTSIPHETAAWLGGIDAKLHAKLVKVKLISPRIDRSVTALGPYFDTYIARRTDLKKRTIENLKQTKRVAVEHFGAGRDMRTITRGDVKDWHRKLGEKYSTASLATFTKKMREVWKDAMDRKLLDENPFTAVKIGSFVNEGRMQYVPKADIEKVIDATEDVEWRALFALARYAGLRVPSETTAMLVSDIDFENKRFTVREGKTKARCVPLFPELERHLRPFGFGNGFVFKRLRGPNMGTTAQKIIKRAKVTTWGKTFHNLRSSCETDLAQEHPLHVACKWIGNSELIARKHYLQVTDADFDRAVRRAVANVGGYRKETEHDMRNPSDSTDKPTPGNMPLGGSSDKRDRSANTGDSAQANHKALYRALHPLRKPKFKDAPDLEAAFAKIRKAASSRPSRVEGAGT